MRKIILINLVTCFLLLFSIVMCKVNTPMPTVARGSVLIDIIELAEPKVVVEEIPEGQDVPQKEQVNDTWDYEDKYLLAKIAMAEAEGCDMQTKCHVISTVLNRVESHKFPNTIKEVIFQKLGNTYQFSPIGDGRWNRVEPNEDCWVAVEKVIASDCESSQGALFFESCPNPNNWHSKNLLFLFNSNGMRFYK